MSPADGVGLSCGMYCFTASWRGDSLPLRVARGYWRMCEQGIVCSFMAKIEVDIVVVVGGPEAH